MNDFHRRPGRWVLAMAVAALSLQSGCRSVQRLPGQWLALPAAAGGQLDDFSRKITSHLFENGMMIGLGNDGHDLYVFFVPDIQRGLRPPGRAVLALWLDAQGGKAEKLGLVHVSGPAGAAPLPASGAKKGDAPEAGAPPGNDRQQLLQVIDRRNGKEMFIAADGSPGPALRLASDWGDFAYQLRIPLHGTGDWPGIAAGPGQEIAIGLLWEFQALPSSEKGRSGRLSRGGPGRGDPGMNPPPGMAGDGPGAGRGLPGETSARKRKIWIRTVLAGK